MVTTTMVTAVMVIAVLVTTTTAQFGPVVVGVHYKCTTDEAVKFVTRQLYPAFLTLNTQNMHIGLRPKRITLQMVPYEDVSPDLYPGLGKPKVISSQEAQALLANKIHACAIAHIRDDWKQLGYLSCLLMDGYEKSTECALATCFDDSLMVSCVNSIDGDLLMAANHNATISIGAPLSSSPVVTFDGAYVPAEQYMARLNLLALVCDKYPGHFERYCEVPRAKHTMAHDNFGTGYYYPDKRRCSFP